jgi:1-acyl-sn-glycerol-3-phosphate acyltransferase
MFWPRLARLILRLGGWTMVGGPPDIKKAVFVGAHHTSNWDGFWALVYIVATGLRVQFFVKKSMFWFPLSIVLRGLGAVPLDRGKAGRAVDQAVELLDSSESFYFGLAPEGTRALKEGWKSGFYRIAERANVPVVLCFFCYRTRRLGIGPMMTLTGDVDADLAIMNSFYETVEGRYPEKASPVVFIGRRGNRA